MAFIVKMDAVKRRLVQDRKNELRRNQRQLCREALVVKEYVQAKHDDVYKEACAFYNYLNSMYPTRSDLRKTDEFKALVKGYTFVAKNQEIVLTKPVQVFRPIEELGLENFTIHCHIPAEPPQTMEESEIIEHPPPQPPQTMEESEIIELTEPSQPGEKIMQLRIPLIAADEITTAANETVPRTEENILTTVCDETVPATVYDNDFISQEVYDQIIKELRQDPLTAKIMDDIELNMDDEDNWELHQDSSTTEIIEFGSHHEDPLTSEINELNMDDDEDIDLPIEEDRLEEELCNIW